MSQIKSTDWENIIQKIEFRPENFINKQWSRIIDSETKAAYGGESDDSFLFFTIDEVFPIITYRIFAISRERISSDNTLGTLKLFEWNPIYWENLEKILLLTFSPQWQDTHNIKYLVSENFTSESEKHFVIQREGQATWVYFEIMIIEGEKK